MSALIVGLVLVPAVDHGLKLLVLRLLSPSSVPLGRWGKLQVVPSQIWLARRRQMTTGRAWCLWSLSATALCVLTAFVPACGWFAGVLAGGSLSHLLETTVRGWIVDYVRLRFWPAFNFADVAITAGALGILVQLAAS